MSLPSIMLQIPTVGVNEAIDLGIMAFSLVLFALSISAYRSTRLKKVGLASIAFVLFAIQLFIEYLDDALGIFEENLDIVLSVITLAILLLFFFAVVKKR